MKNFNRIYQEFSRDDQFKFTNYPFYFVKKKEYKQIYYEDKVYLNITSGHCWATPSPCSNTIRKIDTKKGFIFFKR